MATPPKYYRVDTEDSGGQAGNVLPLQNLDTIPDAPASGFILFCHEHKLKCIGSDESITILAPA